jgi:hypothetical protein
MRTSLCLVAIPLLAGVGFAQDAKPAGGSPTSATEVQTQSYRGTLLDASCAGSGAAASPAADSGDKKKKDDASAGGCTVSANTSEFALKMQDGKTVRFDSVGNMRAQAALKEKKKWSEAASAGKPIRVKVGGVLTGEKLTVVSVD